jgi:hypothetical protein
MRTVRRLMLVLVAAAVLLAAVTVFVQATAPLSPETVRRKTDEINQAAAVTVPHAFNGGAVRNAHLRLFEAVEQGKELSAADSAEYRRAYQEIIFRKQQTLRRFDHQLTVIPDLEMDRRNNVNGLGVEGAHDHHDASMRANLLALETALRAIQDPKTSSGLRVRSAISAYKDTTDILTHLGTVPHTKSTEYRAPAGPLSELQTQGEAMLQDFKQAQFAAVNGPAYWSALWRGLDRFDQVLLRVQAAVHGRLSPAEERLAGRWDSAQSLGRWLTDGSTARRYRP